MSEVIIAAIAAGIGVILTGLGKLIVDTIKAKKEKTGDLELQYTHQERLIELTSGLRNDVVAEFGEIKDNLDSLNDKLDSMVTEQNQINLAMLRHDIVQVYEFYKEKKVIPLAVYESTLNLYDKYKAAGGNSFIDEIVTEIKTWNKE